MRLNQAIERRVLMAAEYIAATGATVRQTARKLGVSKSTVHKDMETRLKQLSGPLAKEVAAVFAKNKAERHLRGGEATRMRYAQKSKEPLGSLYDREAPAFRWTDIRQGNAQEAAHLSEEAAFPGAKHNRVKGQCPLQGFGDSVPEQVLGRQP